MNGENKTKILIIRFSSIGDIVLTTPIVRCLNQQFENCEIHFLTKKRFMELVSHNPYIHHIHTIENNIKEIIPTIKYERYDYIIDLHKNLRTFLLKLQVRKNFLSFSKINFQKWLAVRFKSNKVLPNLHIVDRMMKSVQKLNVSYDKQGLDFFVNPNTQLPQKALNFLQNNPTTYVFSIGGSYYTKKCPPEKVIKICQKLQLPVILIGGKDDVDVSRIIETDLGFLCFNVCGELSIDQSALCIQQTTFTISNDTGMMHIAAALKKPVISLWGNTIPQFGMSPLLPSEYAPQPAIIQVENLSCRPCSKLGFQDCPKKHFRCMMDIDVEEICNYITQNKLNKTAT
jgi:ADP-heptose:LPS heptosyltransferase